VKYRSDIDGLRTIAVFLVIFSHAGFSFVPGGFIGVDVFFVISGFLITSMIFPDIQSKSFSFAGFLSRRIKRLMPVLLFVILITFIVFSFILLPFDLIKFYQSIIWVALDIGNFFMWLEYGGYFNGNSQEAPLLHTWSLAVEEQYYFFWPLMLIVATKYLKKTSVLYLAAFGSILATVFSQWGTEVTIGAAYYLLPTRFFELLIGSSLALFWHQLPVLKKTSQHVLSIVGLMLIAASAVILTEHQPFPGYNALYPIIGTVLIIYSINGIINKLLSLKPIVFTGKISYSLYLWHWPIFVIIRYTSIELTLVTQFIAIVLTYVLSILSWKYIEQPFRYVKIKSIPQIIIKMYFIPATMLIALAYSGIVNNGYPYRYSSNILEMDKALNSHSNESRKGCHAALRDSNLLPDKKCIFGTLNSKQKITGADIFVFGDSHANHLVPFIEVLAKDLKLSVQDYTLDQCLPIIGLNWGGNLYKAKKCKARNQLALEHINLNSFKYIVLSASWPGIQTHRIYTDQKIVNNQEKEKLLKEKLQITLQAIVDTGAVPIIIEDTPTLFGKSPKCPIKKELFNKELSCDIKRQSNPFFKELTHFASKNYPQLIVINPQDLYCKDTCGISLNGIPLYRDDDHLNEVGARYLGEVYLKVNENPFK